MTRYMTWNIEWFTRLFDDDGGLLLNAEGGRLQLIADVITHINPAFIGIIEGPDATNANPTRSSDAMLNFTSHFGLPYTDATIGYRSGGSQEIVALWDGTRVEVQLDQGGGTGLSPAFDGEYPVDTDDDGVKELHSFYRPPLEVTVTDPNSGTTSSVIVCHNKSKGIFNATDLVHWERESRRSRRMLFGQAEWIRRRVLERLDSAGGKHVMVMGDFNDGVGQDWHEVQLGRSSVETIIGDLLEPTDLLRHLPGRPTWDRGGGAWRPASTSFRDRFTGDWVRVLIDFILISEGLQPDPAVATPYFVWNPYTDKAETAPIAQQLKDASDHFPVTVDLL